MNSQLKAFMFEKYFTFTEPSQPAERGWEKEVIGLASSVKKKLLVGHKVKEIKNKDVVVGGTIHFSEDEIEFTLGEQDFIIKKLLIFVPITTTQFETIEMIKD